MKKILIFIFLLVIVGVTFIYKDTILEYYYKTFFYDKKEVVLDSKNEYYRDYNFLYVQNTSNFEPRNKQDIINIFYTVINAGKEEFTFYCPIEYESCINDVKSIAKDQVILSNINNYVHPFNSFSHIATQTDESGKVIIVLKKTYSEGEISIIKQAINNIKNEVINPNLSLEDQLKAIHDYIINYTMYDSNRTDNNVIEYKSDIAYGPLIEGYGICGGYSDAFELFLEELNIKSFKVASDSHVWNAVYLYNNWYHYDLTWDDPVTNTNVQLVEDKFIKLSTKELLELEKNQHNFNTSYYKELAD